MILKPLVDILRDHSVLNNVELVGCIWYEADNEVHWNTDNNTDDLLEGEGDTYSCERKGSKVISEDGYVVYNTHDGCGGTVDLILEMSKRVSHV